MRITAIDPTPLHTLAYRTAAPGGSVLHTSFPLYGATVDWLPDGCQALVLCSDLQGIVDVATPEGDVASCLLGEALAEELALLAELGSIPPATAVGVLLCGDLYVRPALDARGGLGDVRPVWRAFARHFRAWSALLALLSERQTRADPAEAVGQGFNSRRESTPMVVRRPSSSA